MGTRGADGKPRQVSPWLEYRTAASTQDEFVIWLKRPGVAGFGWMPAMYRV